MCVSFVRLALYVAGVSQTGLGCHANNKKQAQTDAAAQKCINT